MDLNHQIPNDVIPCMIVNDTASMYTLTDIEDNKCDVVLNSHVVNCHWLDAATPHMLVRQK
jgi:hypothetical protein